MSETTEVNDEIGNYMFGGLRVKGHGELRVETTIMTLHVTDGATVRETLSPLLKNMIAITDDQLVGCEGKRVSRLCQPLRQCYA
jgi:hypothetical protein